MNNYSWLEAFRLYKPPIIIAALATILRLFFLMLPGPGRDEAIYHYWAFHPEPAYSPLMQLAIRLFDLLPVSNLTGIRLLTFLAGILTLLLFDTLLQRRGLSRRGRYLALAVLAFTPWQTYVGGILHPDNFLLVGILGFLLAVSLQRYGWMTIMASAAVWAKLSGLLLAPAFLFICLFNRRLRCARCWRYPLLHLLLVSPILISLQPELLQGIAEFGRVAEGQSIWESLLLQLGGIFFLAPFGLPFAAYLGLKERLGKEGASFRTDPEQMATLLVAGTMLLAFSGAILTSGQVKGNWILPALVILWPAVTRLGPHPLFSIGLPVSIIVSVSMTFAFANPPAMSWIEDRLPMIRDSYSFQAGMREARVSASRSWTHRFSEYQAIDNFADAVMNRWQNGANGKPAWIVSDDYGLAAKLIFALDDPELRLLVPKDLIFYRSLPAADRTALGGAVLVISSQGTIGNVWARLKMTAPLASLPHPVTGEPVQLGLSNGRLNPGAESGTVDFWRHTSLGRWVGQYLWRAEPVE